MENNDDLENPNQTGALTPSPGTICSFSLIQQHPEPARKWQKRGFFNNPSSPHVPGGTLAATPR